MYRSYYVPVKGAIDGDLCERFIRLDATVREKIAGEVERAGREVERKISVSDFQYFELSLLTFHRTCEQELLFSLACRITIKRSMSNNWILFTIFNVHHGHSPFCSEVR
jgi:hypothetical protein